jgi:hypothetical protein
VQIDRTIAKGQLVQLTFMQDAVAASQTDVQLPIAEVTSAAANAIDGYIMPFAGQIVGISYKLSAAGTTGTFTIGPTVGGTEQAGLTVTVGTTASGRLTVPRDTYRFVAGADIGAEITTGGTWDGTTADLGVSVWVILELDGI